ncbi:ribosomal RNA small subunit methyltransferase E [Spirochaetia bacterium]|nr:ribosomal RNA small subunit methyltransferase E [Spirochaetia bacterium]
MNLILFEEHELGKALPRRDERTTHLIKVLHKKVGDRFDAGVLGGNRGTGIIEKINLDGSILYSLNLDEAPPPRLPLRLAVGFPRPIQLRRLLRDLSNLGLEAIDLIGTELGDKSYRDTKLLSDGGAQAALIEGAVQSRDTLIPALSVYASLEEWLAEKPWDKAKPGTAARLGLGPLLIAADNVRPGGSMARLSLMRRSAVLAIGSERGWSDEERDRLEEAGFLRLSLGERALRTETACVAAAVLALEKIGELG